MTDQPLEDQPLTSAAGEDPRVEVLQAVVDRVASWQEGADEATVRAELDDALAQAGLALDEDTRQRVVERVSSQSPRFDVREVL